MSWFFPVIVTVVALICSVIGGQVPVVMWGFGSSLSLSKNLPSTSALETVSSRTFENDFLRKSIDSGKLLLVFVEEELSLEDFSVNGIQTQEETAFSNIKSYIKGGPTVFLSRVQNPLRAVDRLSADHKVHVIKLLSDSSLEKKVLPKQLKDTEVLVIHLPSWNGKKRFDALKNSDSIIAKVLKSLEGERQMVTVYLGKAPSWDASEHHFLSRKMLSDDGNKTVDGFIKLGDCLYFYSTDARISVRGASNQTQEFSYPTLSEESTCKDTNKTIKLVLDYKNDTYSAQLRMEFAKSYRGWWLKTSEVTVPNIPEAIVLSTADVEAPVDFSYSCYKMVLTNKNSSENPRVKFTLDRFQVEPFVSESSRNKFSPSFDCTPFMTLPIFMGLVVVCIFTAILAFGIYAIMDVKTMDRFDDPRGKSISVPQTD